MVCFQILFSPNPDKPKPKIFATKALRPARLVEPTPRRARPEINDSALSFVSKITNSKHQITNKSQIANHKFKTGSTRSVVVCAARAIFLFWILNFGHCYLFVFWDLLFEISANQIITNKTNPLWGYPKPCPLGQRYLFCLQKPGPLGQVRNIWLCLGVL